MSLPWSLSSNDENETIPSPNSILTTELSDVLEFYLELKVRAQKLEEPGFQAWIRIRTAYRNFTQTNHITDSPAQTRYQGSAKHSG